jgi:hypothetical protein
MERFKILISVNEIELVSINLNENLRHASLSKEPRGIFLIRSIENLGRLVLGSCTSP